jgi:hypothetical protein
MLLGVEYLYHQVLLVEQHLLLRHHHLHHHQWDYDFLHLQDVPIPLVELLQ